MRHAIVLAAGILLLFAGRLAAEDAAQADATGAWTWTIQTGDGNSIDMSADLKQDGQKLTGTFLDGFDQQKFDVKNGQVKDSTVSFTITRPINDATITVNYSGKLEADTMKGTVEIKFGDQDPTKNDWLAKRAANTSAATLPTTQP